MFEQPDPYAHYKTLGVNIGVANNLNNLTLLMGTLMLTFGVNWFVNGVWNKGLSEY